jgi:ribosomal protein S18 acetylase RimI-like enzyme
MHRSASTCRPITPQTPGFQELASDARSEGHNLMERLDREWAAGSNRFEQPGECLLGLFEGATLIAVGGVSRDPYAGDPSIGRIRHIYVRPKWRRAGRATQLMRNLIPRAQLAFVRVRLRTRNPAARRLYERLGFQPVEEPNATHVFVGPLGMTSQ